MANVAKAAFSQWLFGASIVGIAVSPGTIMEPFCDHNGMELQMDENTTRYRPSVPRDESMSSIDKETAISRFPPGGSWKTEQSPLNESSKYYTSPRPVTISGDGNVVATLHSVWLYINDFPTTITNGVLLRPSIIGSKCVP